MTARKPYNGTRRKLVIAFDIGTTYSGVSFSVLDPGIPPTIQGVHKFPAQQEVGGSAKIPSIIYYDNEGNVRAVGAEAAENTFQDEAEDEGYIKAEWFKLHLRPKTLHASHLTDADIPPLPAGKRLVDLFADFMRYLFQCTKEYIINMSPTGLLFWSSIEDNIDFVLAHPNGWEGPQQAVMRQAAVLGGLVDDENAQERVQFVTEGEASLHYCIAKGAFNGTQTLNKGVVIVDAGGGTIDLSAYRRLPSAGYEEIAPTQCHLQGSIFVTRRCRAHIETVLEGTRFGNPDDLSHITDTFDKSTKMSFRNATTSLFIRFGTVRDREPRAGISNGRMKLDGAVVSRFFEPSLSAIVEAVRAQMKEATTPITASHSTVVIVGGFSANEWLFANLQTALQSDKVTVCRPDGFVNKAVADGAVSFYIDHFVSSRVAKFSYGTDCVTSYIPFISSHRLRSSKVVLLPSGKRVLPDHFSSILAKGASVREEGEFSSRFSKQGPTVNSMEYAISSILVYRGPGPAPDWIDDDPDMFSTLCTICADTSAMASDLKPLTGPGGQKYYELAFDVVLLFGLTELKAQIRWMEKGVERRSPAEVIYDDLADDY